MIEKYPFKSQKELLTDLHLEIKKSAERLIYIMDQDVIREIISMSPTHTDKIIISKNK